MRTRSWVMVPPAELESAAFCSASKRSIQLSYEGMFCTVRIIYPSGAEPSSRGRAATTHGICQALSIMPALSAVEVPARLPCIYAGGQSRSDLTFGFGLVKSDNPLRLKESQNVILNTEKDLTM